jgi:hypothetical protein
MNIILTFILLAVLAVAYFVWIRPWQLRWGATDEEVRRPMPGDGIVAKPSFDATRAVTVQAPPQSIYPWIVQMGMTRAGWYSYDLLDNLGRPSARALIPELQQIYAGQIIPMSPDGKQGVYVREFKENEWILWGDKEGDTTWVWGMYPTADGATRLITRVRTKYRWLGFTAIFNLLIEFGDIIMMRKCMLGIKERAEVMSSPAQTTQTGRRPPAP